MILKKVYISRGGGQGQFGKSFTFWLFFYDGFPKCVCKEKMEKITMYFTGTQILLILGISCIYEMDHRINNLFKKLFSKIYIFFCKF